MNPLFSVVIPLYNKEKSIEKTIQTVLDQTFHDFEIIVVNDGSTDNSRNIVKRIGDSRIVLIDEKNSGVASARNTGIRSAKGKYICFLDADDLWEADFLETVITLFQEFPMAKMACPAYQVAYQNRIIHPTWKSVDLEKDSLVHDFYEMATGPFWVCHSSCACIDVSAQRESDCWFVEGEKVYEDFDFWLRFGSQFPIAHSNRICATYVRTAENNARLTYSNKVIYSKPFMNSIDLIMDNANINFQQRKWLREIKDRRMVPYIFSLLLTQQRKTAKKVLFKWKPVKKYIKYKIGLFGTCFAPYALINLVQRIRYKIF